ncbi:MAG: site-specific integrase [Rhodobacteraceae bacterium]|nr:site-specific integrase [Paracoccaceae bacterium]
MTQLIKAPNLSVQDETALLDLYTRGTPENTLRAYERDLLYIEAWKGEALSWPESETVALRFILDHSRDLDAIDNARSVAENLIAMGLRKALKCPAPATLDRRISSWRAFHRMRNLASPFEAPLLRQARAKARRAAARPPAPKSNNPITLDVLEKLLAACPPSLRGTRDRAILMLGWASGGRRRSEITGLHVEDITLEDDLIHIRLLETKTTAKGATPKLLLKGRAAQALKDWLRAAQLTKGPLFRPISKSGTVLSRPLHPDAIRQIIKRLLVKADYDETFASPHGLRSGFLTEAALQGTPIQAAMRLSLHRSVAQAQKYYDDVELKDNPATDLIG